MTLGGATASSKKGKKTGENETLSPKTLTSATESWLRVGKDLLESGGIGHNNYSTHLQSDAHLGQAASPGHPQKTGRVH